MAAANLIGRKYQILQKYGQGQFSTVCRGQCIRSKKTVAIKLEKNTVTYPLLKNEVNILHYLAKQKCDSIPQVLFFGFQCPFTCLVMTFYENGSLDVWKNDLTLEDISEWWNVALSTLKTIHKAGIVHRDIKPAHFMRNAHGDWHLIDFGLATTYLDHDHHHIVEQPRDFIVGSPLYVSYFVHQGKDVTRRDEYLSLLYIAWELIFKRPIGYNTPSTVQNTLSTNIDDPYNEWLKEQKEFSNLYCQMKQYKQELCNNDDDATHDDTKKWIQYLFRNLVHLETVGFSSCPKIPLVEFLSNH